MNKKPSSTIMTRLGWGVFFLALVFLAFQVIPRALGQRDAGKRSVATSMNRPQSPTARENAPLPPPSADSVLNHRRSQPAGQGQSQPVPPPHQIDGIDCNSAPGIVIHDDGGIENGYSGNPTLVSEVRFVDKFTPGSYPASYSSVCLDFVILSGGPPTYPIDVVVYDDDGAGGSPGTLLGQLNGQTATTHLFTGGGQAPIWNSYDISSMGLNVTSGSVYIGTRYVPPSNNVFTSADESGSIGFAGGYWWNNFDGVWSPTQNAFGGYHSMFIRAVQVGGGGTPTPTPTPTPPTDALWYNGDYDGDATGNGLANEQDTFAPGFAHVFDDFIVADSGGWDITSVFSDNQVSTNIVSATWEIRQGMSAGNGGTLVASGSTETPVITPTGRFGFGLPEFKVEVTGLSVHLDPGTYWLNVTPVDSLDGGRSFNSTTLGANCVGTPCGNDQNAFFDSPNLFGFFFEPTLNLCPQCGDFSMGVNGTVSGGGGGNLKLKAGARIADGTKLVRLHWKGATTDKVDIFRNDELLATTVNDGDAVDTLTERGIFVYKVCEEGSSNCSNTVEVRFRGP